MVTPSLYFGHGADVAMVGNPASRVGNAVANIRDESG